MNVVFFMGTPGFAVPSLRTLLDEGYNVVAVVTQPDRPKGRKRVFTPPPVKEEALKHGLPVLQPEKLRAPEAVEELRRYEPDLIVTAAYGQILPSRCWQCRNTAVLMYTPRCCPNTGAVRRFIMPSCGERKQQE